jgi:hypothetical protein
MATVSQQFLFIRWAMATADDIQLLGSTEIESSPEASPSTVTHALRESPSIVPKEAECGSADPSLKPEQIRKRFESFREFAVGHRRRELAEKPGAQAALNNNVQQLGTALNLVEKCLCAPGWSIQEAIELARKASTRPSELTRVTKLLDAFNRAKPVTTPAKQFGARVKEILVATALKPAQAATVTGLAQSSIYRWMSGDFLPIGNKANRAAAVALEGLVDKPDYLQPFLRRTWKTVDRPAHISEKQWRPILAKMRRCGHCDLEGAALSQKIEELLTTPRKPQRAPYRFPKDLERWPTIPRAEIEAYQQRAQLRSEPNWEEIR